MNAVIKGLTFVVITSILLGPQALSFNNSINGVYEGNLKEDKSKFVSIKEEMVSSSQASKLTGYKKISNEEKDTEEEKTEDKKEIERHGIKYSFASVNKAKKSLDEKNYECENTPDDYEKDLKNEEKETQSSEQDNNEPEESSDTNSEEASEKTSSQDEGWGFDGNDKEGDNFKKMPGDDPESDPAPTNSPGDSDQNGNSGSGSNSAHGGGGDEDDDQQSGETTEPEENNDVLVRQICFLAGTKISMADGTYKDVEQIQVGDLVESYDIKNKDMTQGKVVNTFPHKTEEMTDYFIILNKDLKVTPNHPIYKDKKWVHAGKLKIGDQINIENNLITITNIEKIYQKQPTYNFEVQTYHNYLVKINNQDLLVHNANRLSCSEIKDIGDDSYSMSK